MRNATVKRKTKETDIEVSVNLDGTGVSNVATGIGFFDHMLTAFSTHGRFDVELRCKGDLHVDAHHSVEDVGIALGQALREALGDKTGIRRFGDAVVPLDEALVQAAADLSGRPYCVVVEPALTPMIGTYDTTLTQHVFESLTAAAHIALHVRVISGRNAHHIVEAEFKAVARALRDAVALDPRVSGVPSTKGVL